MGIDIVFRLLFECVVDNYEIHYVQLIKNELFWKVMEKVKKVN